MHKLRLSVLGIAACATLAAVAVPSVADAQLTREDLGLDEAADLGLGTADFQSLINSVVQTIMGFLGTIAVLVILWGGFKWMTSGGDQSKVDEARKLIINGVIGLVIILISYAITAFVIDQIIEATSDASTGTAS